MKVILVTKEVTDKFDRVEDIDCHDSRESALSSITRIAVLANVRVKNVVEVDTDRGTIKPLNVELEGFARLKLVEIDPLKPYEF